MVGLFRKIFLLTKNSDENYKSDIRYSDPSHDLQNMVRKKQKLASLNDMQDELARKVLDEPDIREMSYFCIKKCGASGTKTNDLNKMIVNLALKKSIYANDVAEMNVVRDYLHQVRDDLRQSEKIGFNNKTKKWFICKSKIVKLSDKEIRFLKAKGVNPNDCVRVKTPEAAVEWIYNNFTPDDYEYFSCALLQHLEGKEMKVSEKRPVSGADGGVDGRGMYRLDQGNEVPIIFQAKKCNPMSQIGEDVCTKLAGTMLKERVRHAVVITTASISKRSIDFSKQMKDENNLYIDFIDKEKMIEIMTWRDNKIPHGLGIYKSDYGIFYMNKKALKDAASS